MIEGHRLGVELFSVWKAGSVTLARLSDQYGRASSGLNNAGKSADDAFRWGNGTSPVASYYRSIREEVQAILARSAENLGLTGSALCRIAWDYAASDEQAARTLRDDINERLADPNLEHPPTSVTLPQYPHAPDDGDDTDRKTGGLYT